MAEVKEVIISRSCKMNIGNYESVDQFISLKAEVGEFDDPTEVIDELEMLADSSMAKQLVQSYKARGKAMTFEKVVKHHGLARAKP